MKPLLLYLFIAFLPTLGFAQWPIVEIDGAAGAGTLYPAIAINNKNPQNLVVATSGGALYVSQDEGSTWQKQQVWDAAEAGGAPALVSDKKGLIFLIAATGQHQGSAAAQVSVKESKNNGATWEESGALPVTGAVLPRVGINSKGNELIMTWTTCLEGDPGAGSFLMLSRSKDGRKWTEPLRVNQAGGPCSDDNRSPRGAGAVISSDGYLLTSWSQNGKLLLDRSLDKGGMWLSNDIVVADHVGGWKLNGDPGSGGGIPVIAIDNSAGRYNGSLFLVWAAQEAEGEPSSVWLRRSVNFGDNWTPGVKMHDEAAHYRFFPAIAVDQSTGMVYVSYYQQDKDGIVNVCLAYSADNGTSFKFINVTDQGFSYAGGGQTALTLALQAHKGKVVPVWTAPGDGGVSLFTTVIRQEDLDKKAASEKAGQ